MASTRRQSWYGKLINRGASIKATPEVFDTRQKGFHNDASSPQSGLLTLPPEIWRMIDEALEKKSLCNLSLTCQQLYHLCGKHRLRECKIQLGFRWIWKLEPDEANSIKRPWYRRDIKRTKITKVIEESPPIHNDCLNDMRIAFASPVQAAMRAGIRELSVEDLPPHQYDTSTDRDQQLQLQMSFVMHVVIATKSLKKVVWNSRFRMPVDVLHAIEEHHPACRLDLQQVPVSRPLTSDQELWAQELYKSTALESVTIYSRGYGHFPVADCAFEWNVQDAPNLKTIRYTSDTRAYVQFAEDEEESGKRCIDAIKLDIYSPPLPGDSFWQYLNFCRLRLFDTLLSEWSIGTFNPTYFDSLTHLAAKIEDPSDELVVHHLMSSCNIEALALKTSLWRGIHSGNPLSMTRIFSANIVHLRYISLDQTTSAQDLQLLGACCPNLRFLSLEECNAFTEPKIYETISSIEQLLYFRMQTTCSPHGDAARLRFADAKRYDAKDLISELYSILTQKDSGQKLRKIAIRVEYSSGPGAYDDATSCCVFDVQAARTGAARQSCMHVGYDLVNDIHSVGLPQLDVGSEYPMILYKEPWRYRGGCL